MQRGLLRFGSKTLALAKVSSMDVSNGQLVIRGKDDGLFAFASVPLDSIPNMVTLFKLLATYAPVGFSD